MVHGKGEEFVLCEAWASKNDQLQARKALSGSFLHCNVGLLKVLDHGGLASDTVTPRLGDVRLEGLSDNRHVLCDKAYSCLGG